MDDKQEEQTIKEVLDKETTVAVEDAQLSVVQTPTMGPTVNDGPAPDSYAVAVHVMKMAPAWLLTAAVSFVLLIILLSWIRPDVTASGKDYIVSKESASSAANSADLAEPVPPKQETQATENMAASQEAAVSPSPTPTPVELASMPQASTPAPQPVVVESPKESAEIRSPEKQPDASSGSQPKFTVQVSSYSNESSANEQVSRLRAAGFDARTVVVELPGRGKWYRVQAGGFDDRAAASKDAASMRANGVASAAMVVPYQ